MSWTHACVWFLLLSRESSISEGCSWHLSAVVSGRAPATRRERLLCEAFAAALGLPEVGADDDFFVLGGDSIVAMQLVSRVRAAGLVVTPRQILQHKTAEALAMVAGDVQVTGSQKTDDGVG